MKLLNQFCLALAATLSAHADLVITEVMSSSSHPAGYNNGDWWELTNTGASSVDLSDYYWDDGDGFQVDGARFPAITLAAGESILIVDEDEADIPDFVASWGGGFRAFGRDQFLLPFAGSFNDFSGLGSGGDRVDLYNPTGTLVATVEFGVASPGQSFVWATDGTYLGLSSPGALNSQTALTDGAGDVGTDQGSPGLAFGSSAPAPPAFVSPTLFYWRQNVDLAFSGYSIAATDPNGDGISFSSPDAPAWLSLTDNGDYTVSLSGTPTEFGEVNFTLIATDDSPSALTTSVPVTIHVYNEASPIILNEFNAVSPSNFLNGGDASDDDDNLGDPKSDVFFGRIQGNGGNWFELVVVADGSPGSTLDMREWSIDIHSGGGTETIVLTDDAYWQSVPAGTILTFIDRTDHSDDITTPTRLNATSQLSSTGFLWSNIYVNDPFMVDQQASTFGDSFLVDNDDTQLTIRNTLGQPIFGPAGEGVPNEDTTLNGIPDTGGGVSSREVFKLEANPALGIDPLFADAFVNPSSPGRFNDGTSSSFGAPNEWSDAGTPNTQAFTPFVTTNSPPAFTTLPVVTNSGETYLYQIEVSDPDGDNVTISASELPEFLSLTDHGDGTATLNENRPIVASDIGEYPVRLNANDGNATLNTTPQSFILNVQSPDAEQRITLHQWDFEDDENLLDPAFTLGGGQLGVVDGPSTQVLAFTGGDFISQHLRINNPIGATVTFQLPTTGYRAIQLDFLTRRSGSGAGTQTLEYSTNGSDWITLENYSIANAPPQPRSFNFAAIEAADDNPDFAVRITFSEGSGGTAGNNRFDDVVLSGLPLAGTNLPPAADPENFPQQLAFSASDSASTIDLNSWIQDPDGDPISFLVSSSNSAVLTTELVGNSLTLTPVSTGESLVSITADDGENPPIEFTLRLLIFPTAHSLSTGSFTFNEWSSSEPSGSFPDHMIFLQSDQSDPPLDAPLAFAYQIPANDAAEAIDTDQPYNAQNRTRLNGLGSDGISFINTGRGRDLGSALVALDTTGQSDIQVGFTAGTILPNSREYALRLQYRIGLDGEWVDLLDDGAPVEYLRNAAADHTEVFAPITLPAELENQPLVHLQWRYYYLSGSSGPRAMLRLDDIIVSAQPSSGATNLAFDSADFTFTQSGFNPGTLTVRATDSIGLLDTSFNGTVTLSLSGTGTLGGTTSVNALNGIATFDNWIVTGGSGEFSLNASAAGLSPDSLGGFKLTSFPVFLPGGSATWNLDAHWSNDSTPNAISAQALVPPPAAGNRNVELSSPVTLGQLHFDNADSPGRNRLRESDLAGVLTFNAGLTDALLRIDGTGTGFVELNNQAGTVLNSNLTIEVNNIEGDADYGALRLRETWSGNGGITKLGPGVASWTGDGKNFSGPIAIEQGVLAFSSPATPANVSGIEVQNGGQLRLTSASSSSDPIRQYSFGGTLNLAGSGRSGVPTSEGQGVLGALRYEPGSLDNHAEVSTPVNLTNAAVVHVSNEFNLLTLSGPLSGAHALSKTGGGKLIISGDSSGFSGSLNIDNGLVAVNSNLNVPVTLAENSTLTGNGTVTTISGNGSIATQANQTLSANSATGINLSYQLDGSGLLRLTNASPLGAGLAPLNSVSLFLNEIPVGNSLSGLIFSDQAADLANLVASASWSIFVADPAGEVMFNNQSYSLSDLTIQQFNTVATTITVDATPIAGSTLELTFAGGLSGFNGWVSDNFSPEQQADPNISGPNASPLEDNVPNLLKYALGLTPLERVSDQQLNSSRDGNELVFRFHLDPSLTDITYQVEASNNLTEWNTTLFDSSAPPIDHNTPANIHEIRVAIDASQRFIRLKIVQN